MSDMTPPMDSQLVLDVGNTRTKWGVFSPAGALLLTGAVLNEDVSEWAVPSDWQGCHTVFVANVAGPTMLDTWLAKLRGFSVQVLKATALACEVQNGYANPSSLGVDRWAALIAAWHQSHAAGLVVNAGTALTVDALVDQQGKALFKGGVIVPGFRLMQTSLNQRTADVQSSGDAVVAWPSSTAEAVATGAMHAMVGTVVGLWQQLKNELPPMDNLSPNHHEDLVCWLTGGDALRMLPYLQAQGVSCKIDEHLVLKGLWRMGNQAS